MVRPKRKIVWSDCVALQNYVKEQLRDWKEYQILHCADNFLFLREFSLLRASSAKDTVDVVARESGMKVKMNVGVGVSMKVTFCCSLEGAFCCHFSPFGCGGGEVLTAPIVYNFEYAVSIEIRIISRSSCISGPVETDNVCIRNRLPGSDV